MGGSCMALNQLCTGRALATAAAVINTTISHLGAAAYVWYHASKSPVCYNPLDCLFMSQLLHRIVSSPKLEGPTAAKAQKQIYADTTECVPAKFITHSPLLKNLTFEVQVVPGQPVQGAAGQHRSNMCLACYAVCC